MIVRIMQDAQYDLEGDAIDELNEIDERVIQALHDGDEAAFHAGLRELIEEVRVRGERLPDDFLGTSDVVIPPEDLSMEEARAYFHEDGLVPGHAPSGAAQ